MENQAIDSAQAPLVSVIVPTCNRPLFLRRALASIQAQTYRPLEIVLVDDNVADSPAQLQTQDIARPFQEAGLLQYIRTEGRIGGGAARNLAVRAATGAYLAFLDDDDCYLPEKIERQLAFMREHALDMCFQDVKWLHADGRLAEHRRNDFVRDFSQQNLLRQHILRPIAPTAIYMLRREAFDRTQGFGEVRIGQDYLLMLGCIEAGLCIGYMPGAYVHQYLHDGERISLGHNKIQGENALYALRQQYFHLLDRAERRYVRFRHYAVLAFACWRSRMYARAIGYAVRAALTSPAQCLREAKRFFAGQDERAALNDESGARCPDV